jgi:hypothetical protein
MDRFDKEKRRFYRSGTTNIEEPRRRQNYKEKDVSADPLCRGFASVPRPFL